MIRFLNKQQSINEFSTSDYLKDIRVHEFKFRQNKKKLKAKSRTELMLFYFDSIMEFSYKDQEILYKATTLALQKLNKWFPDFLKDHEIKFIKVEGSLDWHMPYTINNCIVMPYTSIKSKDLVKTIVHELIHIHQRINPEFYNNLYSGMFSFEHTNCIINLSNYENITITNPDVNNTQWIIQLYDGLYYPAMIYINNTSQEVLFRIKKDNNNCYVVVDYPIKAHSRKDYIELLRGCNEQISHPNEIMACSIVSGLFKN